MANYKTIPVSLTSNIASKKKSDVLRTKQIEAKK